MIDWVDDWWIRRIEVALFALLMLSILMRAVIRFLRWVERGYHWNSGPSPLRRLRCRIGLHSRSLRDRHRDDEGVTRSRCRGCRRPMSKDEKGRWIVGAPA